MFQLFGILHRRALIRQKISIDNQLYACYYIDRYRVFFIWENKMTGEKLSNSLITIITISLGGNL